MPPSKTPRSLEHSNALRERARRVVPGLAQTFSKGPLSFVGGVAPSFVSHASGAHVWDVDGNRYIDYILGLGPVILGHAHEAVNQAVAAQLARGTAFSLSHPGEVQLSELLCELIPCAEMVRFGKNGSDATSGAIRLARACTGRDKVARCGYHGWQDWYIGSTSRHKGVPEAVRALTLSFPYNGLDALDALFRAHRGEIACVILEPVTFDEPAAGYLAGVRDLCHREGALLVFDEVITGFRLHLGGAQSYFGVTPDLACFGKAMANGFPLSAIAGRADYMRQFEEVFFSFTFGGEAASIAAALATIGTMRSEPVVEALWSNGAALREGANAIIEESGLREHFTWAGLAPWTTLRCLGPAAARSLEWRSLFQQECLEQGILTHGNHMLSFAHGPEIVAATLDAYRAVFPVMAEAAAGGGPERFLRGAPMQAVMRQS
ncbi:MAG: aminotransferase class III-fold pyridoxal phosphate-dependent enzyme [Bryobacterales bacterium]|nr:aminotransferase class III-fold pyridoxal phosphate-dependent enzyme [Bryobacterales bacterium]